MSQMDYFRRAALAGKNITHPTTGRVRGNVRRSDADGTSAVPYFPAVTPADTLNIETDAGTNSVVLTAKALNTILSDINTALGATGTAYSENGCIGLATSTAGGLGFIRVTGGTASAALGFNTFGGVLPIEGRSSDLFGAPEGETGNPFGAVFPARENLSSEVLVRNLGRLASNADVLWSDHAKNSISFKTVAFVVGTAGAYITPTSTQRLFVGGGLSAASTRRQLATYYQLIDTVTGLPANSQVAAVVRGTPVGAPPYADSPSWTDTSGKNVLGVGTNGQEKVSSETITSITGGRFVECAGGTFVSDGVVAGDFAQIVSATNLTPSSNNGMKWIVESVISETALTLRPMSKSELDTTGFYTFPPEQTQPVVELNDNRSGPEVFGALVVKTGPFAHNVTLVVLPPIPTNASYELRAAVPLSLRDDKAQEKQFGVSSVLAELGNDLDPTDNWILDGLSASIAGPNCVVTAGYVRHHGKVFYVPTQTFTATAFTNGNNYLYWSEATGGLVSTTAAADFGSVLNNTYAVSSSNRGHPVAFVVKAGGIITSVKSMVRRRAEKAISFTVGASGQFQTLEAAVRYANAISTVSGETTSNSGSYPHFEFVITNNLTLTEDITFTGPSVTLRGIDPRTLLTMGGQRFNIDTNVSELIIKDLLLSGTSAAFVQVRNTANRVTLQNLRHIGVYGAVIKSVGGTCVESIIDSCTFSCDSVLTLDPGTNASIRFKNSDFYFGAGTSTPQIIKESASANWSGKNVRIEGCRFLGAWITSSLTNALCVSLSSGSSKAIVRDTEFELGDHLSAFDGILFSFSGDDALVENVKFIDGKIPRVIAGASARVIGCSFSINPEGTSIGVLAREVTGCSVLHADTDANAVGGVGIQANLIYNNSVSGPCATGISVSGDDSTASSNVVNLNNGANAFPLIGIEGAAESQCFISDNTVFMPARPAGAIAAPAGIAQTAAPIFRLAINNNFVSMTENGSGIRIGTTAVPRSGENVQISGNNISGAVTAGGVMAAVRLHGTIFSCEVSENQMFVSGVAGEANGIFHDDGTNTHFEVRANRVFIDGPDGATGGVYYDSTPDVSHVIQGNFFQAGTATQRVSGFRGIVSGNQFLSGGTCLISNCIADFSSNLVTFTAGSATLGSGRYDNNTFTIPSVNASTSISDFQFTNNRLSGNYSGGSPITNVNTMFSGNKVAGTAAIGAGAATKVVIANNEFLSTLTVNAGTGNQDVVLNGNYVGGDASLTSNRNLVISNCIFVGTGTQTVSGGGRTEVIGNEFVGRLSMTGLSADQLVANNKLAAGVVFTADASPAFWKVEGNRIQSAYNVRSVQFPVFSFPAQVFITVNNNTIQHGCGEDSASNLGSTVSAIYFAGDISGISVVGNNIAIGRNNTNNDPGGTGTLVVACLHIVGTGTNRANVITGNMMDIPAASLSFRAGALILDFMFWYFGSAQETGGAGNILSVNAGVPNTAPHNGSSFFQNGAATPYKVE